MKTTQFVDKPEELYKLLLNPGLVVTEIFPVSDTRLNVVSKPREGMEPDHSGQGNIFICIFTTAWARLKLYEELEKLDSRVYYMDT